MLVNEQIAEARQIINNADALMILAGAGMGVDSGLPDFRGNEGFWKAYPPIARLGYSFSEMANPAWFKDNPRLAWGFYGHRLNLYRSTNPHPGFQLILNKAKTMPGGYFVYTSNVDGQFQIAGFHPNQIEEAHGSIHHLQCTVPCCSQIWDARNVDLEIDLNTLHAVNELPVCPHCGAIARPNILMFGDWNWLPERSNKQGEKRDEWFRNFRQNYRNLVLIELGAGNHVPTVRMTSQRICRQFNARLIRINPREFDVPTGQIGLAGGALQMLQQIL